MVAVRWSSLLKQPANARFFVLNLDEKLLSLPALTSEEAVSHWRQLNSPLRAGSIMKVGAKNAHQ